MANNRIYYAIQQVALRPNTSSIYTPIHGLQSVGMTANFNLVQAFELGQLSLYENIEDIPDIQMTLNKVLDGYLPIFCNATQTATTPTLAARAVATCIVNLSVYDESLTSASGIPVGQVECSGLYVSTIRYNFPRDGNFSEEVTLVGNHRIWKNDSRIVNTNDLGYVMSVTGAFAALDSPIGQGGVARRQDLSLTTTYSQVDANGAITDPDCTILPSEIAGIGSNGVNTMTSAGRAHLNTISVSANLNREALNELGRKAPYFRTPTFPIEVTTEIEITATSGDLISATEAGIYSNAVGGCGSDSGNLKNSTIRVATCEGTRIYCGTKNKIASVNYTGGDAGGGQVAVSYTYRTFNDFTVIHTQEQTLGAVPSGFWVNRSGHLSAAV